MKRIIFTLMESDNLSFEEAESIVLDTHNEIMKCLAEGGGYEEVSCIMQDELGLEMDYIMDMFFSPLE